MSKKKSRKHNDRFFPILISALVLCAVVLALAIAIESKLNAHEDSAVQAMSGTETGTPEPLTMMAADSLLAATPEPIETSTAAPVATSAPVEYLPVYKSADTTERIIAITIDDCSNLTFLKKASDTANKYKAALTLFPTGNGIMKEGMTEAMRTCVLELGYQVENYTWSSQNLYRLGDGDMALEIWSPDMALDYALNKDYTMHLLRPRNGAGTRDPRTNAYLKQLGYDGFITWTAHASDMDIEKLKNALKPGGIYAFKTTEADMEELVEFMRFAHNRDYKMVTVNDLLGFAANPCTEVTDDILSRSLPMPENKNVPAITYKAGDRAWQVMLIQSRLAELGYLDPNGCDGVFGDGTSSALIAFQAKYGLPCTGVATVEMQNLLFSADALKADAPASPEA